MSVVSNTLQSNRHGLVIQLAETGDFSRLCEQLEVRLADMDPVERGRPVTLNVGARLLSTQQLLELEAIVNRHAGVHIVQIMDSAGALAGVVDPGRANGMANRNGTSGMADSGMANGAANGGDDALTMPASSPWPISDVSLPASDEPARSPSERAAAVPRTAPVPGGAAQLVHGTIRSGQRVVSAGHIVVLGDVNPGAEVVAVGDVVVMGCLRGLAHAGARGDDDAIIAAIRLQPMQIRIGGHIGRPPDEEAHGGFGPEVARVRSGAIIIEAYHDVLAGMAT